MVNAYRNNLEKLYIKFKDTIITPQLVLNANQIYENIIEIDEGGDYFNILLDINKLDRIRRQSPVMVKLQEIPIDELINFIDINNLDEKYFKKALRNNSPIMVGFYPCLKNNYMVFDGNHRAYSNYKAGKKVFQLIYFILVIWLKAQYLKFTDFLFICI